MNIVLYGGGGYYYYDYFYCYCYRSIHQPLVCLVSAYQSLGYSILTKLNFWAEANSHLFPFTFML